MDEAKDVIIGGIITVKSTESLERAIACELDGNEPEITDALLEKLAAEYGKNE